MPTYDFKALKQFALIYGKVSENDAEILAAIALAESGGNSDATHVNTNGTTDYGLWQINSVHGYNVAGLMNPAGNADAAGRVFRSQGFKAWTVYNTGAYKQFLPDKSIIDKVGGAVANPNPIDIGKGIIDAGKSAVTNLNPVSVISDIFNWVKTGIVALAVFNLGLALIGLGVFLIVRNTKFGEQIQAVGLKAATKGAV